MMLRYLAKYNKNFDLIFLMYLQVPYKKLIFLLASKVPYKSIRCRHKLYQFFMLRRAGCVQELVAMPLKRCKILHTNPLVYLKDRLSLYEASSFVLYDRQALLFFLFCTTGKLFHLCGGYYKNHASEWKSPP